MAMHAASLAQLEIAHWPGPPAGLPAAPAGTFVLDTCQRRVAITSGDGGAGRGPSGPSPAERRSGAAAYRLLLEVTTGLLSAVPGETNVFGQFRRAWDEHRASAPERAATLAPLIARAVHDTRAIRRRHLQNIGGASYGGLVRRLLRAADGERVLVVGAGGLACSLLPFLDAFEIATWNRTPPGAAFAAAGRVFAPDEGQRAAGWAHHVVLTTPADPLNDGRWSAWLDASLVQTVVHLGRRRGSPIALPAHASAYDLDDIFDLRRSQEGLRSLQIERARQECRDRAEQLAGTGVAPARLAAG
jgi:hypothetical protein